MKYSLIGVNGNAFAIMGYVRNCMQKEGKTEEEKKAYIDTARSGDYNNLLAVSLGMIDELNEKREEEFDDDNEDCNNFDDDDDDEDCNNFDDDDEEE